MITKLSDKGLDMIKSFEGFRSKAYYDSVGVLTIGYGTTNSVQNYTKYTVKVGATITEPQAAELLRKAVEGVFAKKVTKYDDKYHWNQNQFDALCSFAYNIGSIDNLTNRGTRSIEEISNKFTQYCKAGGIELAGLKKRRLKEKELFDTPVDDYQEIILKPNTPKKNYPIAVPTLKKGKKGENVKILQADLNYIMNTKLDLDGDFGPATDKALRKFQKKYNLVVDGIYGKLSENTMRKVINGG